MADKAINDLTQASQITDDDLFVLQQQGTAKKLRGETLLKFLTFNVLRVSTETLSAGSQATATFDPNTGTLTLGIPKGDRGAQGTPGATGPANTLKIGTVTSGTVASATITGTAPNQTLNLVLKQGDKGDNAPTITGITIRQSDYHMIVSLSNGTSYDAGYCRGASGSGTGDMQASVYDPQGKRVDIFKFVTDEIAKVQPPDISGKLDKTGDGSNVTASFSKASTRVNIATGEKLSVLFGKIAKWLGDLGTLAFKSSVAKSDLASDVQTSLGKADSALQSAPVTSVNGQTGAVTVASADLPKTTALLKGNGSGGALAATAGTDYMKTGNITKQTLVATKTTPKENNAINWYYGS